MAKILITKYKGWEIYWEDDRENTLLNPHWIASKGIVSFHYDRTYSLDKIKKHLDGVKDDGMFTNVIKAIQRKYKIEKKQRR